MKTRFRLRLSLALLLALQVLLVLIGAGVAARQPDQSDTIADKQRAEPGTLPLTIESGLPAARERAADWRSDAALMAMSMQIDWPLMVDLNAPSTVAPGGWITYTFAAPASHGAGDETMDIEATLSLLYERRSGSLVDVEEIKWPDSTAVTPFTAGSYPVSSSTAVTALELKQARAWRAACPSVRHVTHVSLARIGNAVWWVVSYGDTRTGVAALQGRVNVQSGELEDVIDRSKACDKS